MDLYCDYCGFQDRHPLGGLVSPGRGCAVCGLGGMRAGRPERGFLVRHGQLEPVNLRSAAYRPLRRATAPLVDRAGGAGYQRFLAEETVPVPDFADLVVPQPGRFAWLSRCPGTAHGRYHFTQLVLATVAQAAFAANGGRFPRLVEPFVGAGQLFLTAAHWGTSLNRGVPLFHRVLAGDRDPYLTQSYRLISAAGPAAVDRYAELAASADEDPLGAVDSFARYLDRHGAAMLAEDADAAHRAAMMRLYLANRSRPGRPGRPLPDLAGRAAAIRAGEVAALTAVQQTLRGLSLSVRCRDMAETCALAAPGDVAFLDCPVPAPSTEVPAPGQAAPERVGARAAADAQSRIVRAVAELLGRGVCVVVSNLANPGLVRAYQRLLDPAVPVADRRRFTFSYQIPGRVGPGYQLTVLPAGPDPALLDIPDRIIGRWRESGGAGEPDTRPAGVAVREAESLVCG